MAKKKSAKNKTKKTEKVEKVEKKVEKKTEAPKTTEQPKKKSKKALIFSLIAVGLAAIAGIVIALVLNFGNSNLNDATARVTYSNAFFISDDGKYMLYNADGKRLNEDDYSDAYRFVGGYALVKKDGQYGVVKEDGKMSIDFGKFGNIEDKGGLYLAQDGNTKEYYLLTGSGKELAKGSELKVYSPSYTSGYAAVETNGKIKVFNYAGKLIVEVEEADDADTPEVISSNDFGILYYGNTNYLFDVRSGSLIAQFEGQRYRFDEVSESRKVIILENSKDYNKYKLVVDGKVYDLEETKYYSTTALDHVIGYDNYSELALLDDNYKVAKRVGDYIVLKDYNNYAVETDTGVEIYKNGEKIKEFADAELGGSGVLYENYYPIIEEDKAVFYNLDGTVGINHEYKTIKSAFDRFHHAVVSDEEGKSYLIDARGNRIDDTTFKFFAVKKGGYELKNADGKYAIANKDGKPVTDFKYTSTYYRSDAEPRNIWTGSNSTTSYDVIDVDKGTVILENVNVKEFYNNYFTIKNSDGKTEYYTYDGTLIYTSK